MIDEEKAEEILHTKGFLTYCEKGCIYTAKVKELIAIGLAEGEKIGKEKQWKATETAQKKTSAKIKELEKEIEEQKVQIEKMKCCGNCDNNPYCEKEHYGNDKGCENWECAE